MNTELVKSFYTLRSALVLVDSVRSKGDSFAPFNREEYTHIMDAYHSIQGALNKIYRRESEFFSDQTN
jgi:hypothetical protein